MTTLTEEQIAELRAILDVAHDEWGEDCQCPHCGEPLHLSDGLEPSGLCDDCKQAVVDLGLALLDDREALKRERDQALKNATLGDTVASHGFAAKDARIAALVAGLVAQGVRFADLEDAHNHYVAQAEANMEDVLESRRTIEADLARVTAELAEERQQSAWTADALLREQAEHTQAVAALAEYKRAVVEQLHYDMQSVITGTPEHRAAATLAERTRECDAARKVAALAKCDTGCSSRRGDSCDCGLAAAQVEAGL